MTAVTSVTRARRPPLSVAQRLFLGLLPSLLAVALVAGLAYYGEYARRAPGAVVGGAAALALASLALTWLNARDLAARVARLAGASTAAGAPDELDRIAQVVDALGAANAASAARVREQATAVAAAVASAVARLDEVRLPLHILLDAKFGELNENQEELLGTARDAADAMDAALRGLGQLADADRGALAAQREPVPVNDVVRAVLPLVRASAARGGARVDVALEPGLPRALGDRVRLAEAFALLGERAVAAAVRDAATVVVTTARGAEAEVAITIAPVDELPALARRLIEAQGGRVAHDGDRVTVTLAAAPPYASP